MHQYVRGDDGSWSVLTSGELARLQQITLETPIGEVAVFTPIEEPQGREDASTGEVALGLAMGDDAGRSYESVQRVISSLERLANHSGTPPSEAANARARLEELKREASKLRFSTYRSLDAPGEPGYRGDDADWKEGDHPRDGDGKFSSGGGGGSAKVPPEKVAAVIKEMPKPPSYSAAAGKGIENLVTHGLKQGLPAEDIATAIKELTSNYKYHAAWYANAAIGYLENVNGLASGSLGKAKHKDKGPKAAAPPKPAPPKPAAAAPGSGPLPHPESKAQQLIYEIGVSTSMSVPDKLQAIQEQIVGALPSGYTVKYANEWTKALGGEVIEPEFEPEEEEPDEPPPPPPPKPAPSGSTPKPGVTHGTPSKVTRGQQVAATAHRFSSTKESGASKVARTLKPAFWEQVQENVKHAVRSYTDGSYHSLNGALRKPKEGVDKAAAAEIDAIDELFETPEARLTDDVILHRGEDVPVDVLDGLVEELKSGVPCRYKKEGFISTSMANKAAFGHKNVQFEIVARKGTPALGVAPVSMSKSENEVLMRHGQTFEIYEVERVGSDKAIIRMYSIV